MNIWQFVENIILILILNDFLIYFLNNAYHKLLYFLKVFFELNLIFDSNLYLLENI